MAKIPHAEFLNLITVQKTEDFTADGESGTVYIVSGAIADVEILLLASGAESRLMFVNADETFNLRIKPASGETIKFWNEAGSDVRTVEGDDDEWLQVDLFGSVTILKTSATNWAVVNGNGFRYND